MLDEFDKLLMFDRSLLRHRCLEAIIKCIFPNDPIETTADLLALGRREGFTIPDASSMSRCSEQREFPSTPDRETIQEAQWNELSVTSDPDNRAISVQPEAASQPSTQATRWQSGRNSISLASRFVHDSSGGNHYIGPFGTLSFFAELRELVSETQPSSRFATDNVAEALEARPDLEESPYVNNDDTSRPPGTPPESIISTSSTSQSDLYRSAIHLKRLPSQITESLLHIYFAHVNPNFPLFHRAMFQDKFERYFTLSAGGRSDPSTDQSEDENPQLDEGWLVCLHVMLFFGCVWADGSQSNSLRNEHFNIELFKSQCWNLSRATLPSLTTTCTLSNVQALLLIALHYHANNERNSAWTLVGCAARISIALGLHRDDVKASFRLVERETRRLVFCTLYAFEEFLCMSLGRPSAIDDAEVNVTIPSDDMMGTNHGQPGYAQKSFELHLLSSRIRKSMSLPIQGAQETQKGMEAVTYPASYQYAHPKALLDELRLWEKKLPTHLVLPESCRDGDGQAVEHFPSYYAQISPHHLRAIVLLHLQYHNLVILVSRPYLLLQISLSAKKLDAMRFFKNGHTTGPNVPLEAMNYLARTCVSSALRVTTLILLLYDMDLLNGLTWLDIFYAYSAGMVLVLRILWTSYSSLDQNLSQAEKRLTTQLRAQVMKLRQVLSTLKKCPTMHRFASVLENFAEAVTSPMATRTTSTVRGDSTEDWESDLDSTEKEPRAHLRRQSTRKLDTVGLGDRATTTNVESSNAGAPRNCSADGSLERAGPSSGGPNNSSSTQVPNATPVHTAGSATVSSLLQTYDTLYVDMDSSVNGANGSFTEYFNQHVPLLSSGSYQSSTRDQEENVNNGGDHGFLTDCLYALDPSAFPQLNEQESSPNTLLPQDAWHAVTQHALGWNDFERFLGSLGKG
jgi:proline utilization trans-activator